MPNLFLIFNHELTSLQKDSAFKELGVGLFYKFPPELERVWSQIPPYINGLTEYLKPIIQWLSASAKSCDYVLIQGDFGACYLMVQTAFQLGLIPIYSTTRREATEAHGADGTVQLMHQFKHVIFRKYGA
jgi:hypothetical protein